MIRQPSKHVNTEQKTEKERKEWREKEKDKGRGETESFCNSLINPLHAAGRFLHSLKASENLS